MWIGKHCYQNGKTILLAKGGTLPVEGKQITYIGEVEDVRDVPEDICIFSLKGLLYLREIKYNTKNVKVEPRHKPSNSEKLNFTINKEDDSLMIIIKTLLNEITKEEFSTFFKNSADMNNYKKQLEHGNGSLSMKRFNEIMRCMKNLDYTIKVYDVNTNEIKVEI